MRIGVAETGAVIDVELRRTSGNKVMRGCIASVIKGVASGCECECVEERCSEEDQVAACCSARSPRGSTAFQPANLKLQGVAEPQSRSKVGSEMIV